MKPAKDIKPGESFVKRNGSYVYIRISPDSVKFHGLPEDQVYGVNFMGTMTTVGPETLVHVGVREMWEENIRAHRQWEEDVGVKQKS